MENYTDTITILQARDGKRMAKMLLSDGTFEDYDDAYYYDAETVPLTGLDDLWPLLLWLLSRRDRCVVRGALINLNMTRKIRRLVCPCKKNGDPATLIDVPRRWLAIDADGIERPKDVPASDLLACADAVIEKLPKPFWRAQCFVQASAGHGIKPGCRLRLWYWCDRPMSGTELKYWLKGVSVDHSVFNPVQPIYTAAPIFADGIAEHLPYRLIEWPGGQWLQCPSAEELTPPPRPTPEYVAPVAVSRSARARLYVEGAMNKAGERIRNASQRHPTILQEACSLARFVKAGMIAKSDLHNLLWNAAQSAGKDDEAEIERMVTFGIDHPDSAPIPVEVFHG